MSDLGDTFNAMKEESKQRRASHRENSAVMLDNKGIPFVSKNGGAHLIVEGSLGYIDFWPGTGRWRTRNGYKGFGVRNLIKQINEDRI